MEHFLLSSHGDHFELGNLSPHVWQKYVEQRTPNDASNIHDLEMKILMRRADFAREKVI